MVNFSRPWTPWKKMWSWHPRVSMSGKMLWGRMMTRQNTLALNGNGTRINIYASVKEAEAEDKEWFLWSLKSGI